MERIWAPWRMKYIETGNIEGCIFCVKPKDENDEKNYIIKRGKTGFVLLNLYPYIGGHMMAAPYKHTGSLSELSAEEMTELFEMTRQAAAVLTDSYKPDGFNIGLNIGEVAGAGFGDHVHVHIVPRWARDTNFMPVLADTRVISASLDETYEKVRKTWLARFG
ncbi:MAG: HIT domain-containing protein [Actinomycetota bacterium]